MERLLQDLNNLKTKEGLTLQWKEKAAKDGQWQVTGDLRTPGKGLKLQETNVASTKNAGRKMCAAVLLARYKTPILAQSDPLGTETADTTRTTDNEPPADDLEQQVKLEDRIRMSLLGYGRQPVSARELQRRISSEGFEFDSKSKSATVNRVLYKLLKDNLVIKYETDRHTCEKMTYWVSAELELTSIEEVATLVSSINETLIIGSSHKYLHTTNPHPEYFDVEYSHSVSPVRSLKTDYGDEAESVRYTGVVKLLAQNAAYLQSPVQGASRPCVEPIPVKIQAHHNLLRSMSVSSVFTADFQDRCKKIWSVAYMRGRSLHVGEIFPFKEDQFLEFKGARTAGTEWTYADFKKYHFERAPCILASFINGAILNMHTPADGAKIIFGIHDATCTMHGILLPTSSRDVSPSVACKKTADELTEQLHRRLKESFQNPPGWSDRVIESLTLEVTLLSSDNIDKVFVIVTITLDLAATRVVPRATALNKAFANSKSRYFIRTAVPETRTMTKVEANAVFGQLPLGFPE